MCNDNPSKTSRGGAVARIHPTGLLPASSEFTCLLQFQNYSADPSAPTTLSYSFFDHHQQQPQMINPCKLRIHQNGDLMSAGGQILYSLDLSPLSAPKSTASLLLDRRLDLGVGEYGIIGRMVSVVDGKEDEVVLGEGVIGWN
ncbi:hypothetical protein RUND412_008118 [Rhizina undulata]